MVHVLQSNCLFSGTYFVRPRVFTSSVVRLGSSVAVLLFEAMWLDFMHGHKNMVAGSRRHIFSSLFSNFIGEDYRKLILTPVVLFYSLPILFILVLRFMSTHLRSSN